MSDIKVTIHCPTYNHEKYIAECLESFVRQVTNFKFQVFVIEDCSTDSTREIVVEYAKKYPEIIKPILPERNIAQNEGFYHMNMLSYKNIKSKYVLICEGDDYFIDCHKLQKQVDYLDAHPECSICFHPVKVVWENNQNPDELFPSKKQRFGKNVLGFSDIIKYNFMQTNSVMYRWIFKDADFSLIPHNIQPGDYFLHLLHAQTGKIGFIPDVMAVYRRHEGGIWTGAGKTDEWFLRCGIPHIRFNQAVERIFNVDRNKTVINVGHNVVLSLLKNKQFSVLQEMSVEFADLWDKFISVDPKTNKKIRKLKIRSYFLLGMFLILSIIIIYLFLNIRK